MLSRGPKTFFGPKVWLCFFVGIWPMDRVPHILVPDSSPRASVGAHGDLAEA